MKTKFNYVSLIALMAMAFGFLLVSCEKDVELSGELPLGGGTYIANLDQEQPVLVTGNPFCEDGGDFDLSSGKIDWDGDQEKWEIEKDEEYSNIFPFDGVTVTVTDNKYVSFVVDSPLEIDGTCYALAAVIVKGGPNANVYYYDYRDGVTQDQGLHSPLVGNGNIADLSNLSFCFIEVPCEENLCETAWAANYCGEYDPDGGILYVDQGNWATYVEYIPGKYVTLFAGQSIDVGTVGFIESSDQVRIRIYIEKEGWVFCPVEQNVKIDGFNSLEEAKINDAGNPQIGLFTYKVTASGTYVSILVDKFNYYGVHVDVGPEE